MKNAKAFTLIELLVVIAIIAILAAILFPVFAQAKLAAKKTASLSNMKQTALAGQIYGNDFDDFLPAGGDFWDPGVNAPLGWNDTPYNQWVANFSPGPTEFSPNYPGPDIQTNPFQEVYPYIKSMGMLDSPVATQDGGNGAGFVTSYTTNTGGGNTSYVANGGIEGLTLTGADNPAGLITFAEGPTNTRVGFSQPQEFLCCGVLGPVHVNGIDINWVGEAFPGNAGNYSFGDGHAKALPRSQITYANYGLAGWVYDNASNAWQPNTYHMHSLTQGNPDYWPSCGHIDITSTNTATGLVDSTNNPCL
jgi:prepilin-type N-terminal cleavage/methylation domain-containing protein/prepilin-type processing-associated H-X9-DG protein